MPKRVAGPAVVSSPKPAKQKDLPSISIAAALSKKIDKAIVGENKMKEKQLKFRGSSFESPAGNKLQVVYLKPAAAKSGLSIAYVDAKTNQFWAQSPGVSGLAKGPFKLPAGVGKELAKVTERGAPPEHGTGVRTDGDRMDRGSGGSGGRLNPRPHGGSGGYHYPAPRGGSAGLWGGGGGGGGSPS